MKEPVPAHPTTQPWWVCRSQHTRPWNAPSIERELVPEDMQITDSRYCCTLTLYRCRDCGFIFADTKEIVSLTQLYEQLVDPEYEHTQDTRLMQMQWLVEQALKHRPGARTWLDIG